MKKKSWAAAFAATAMIGAIPMIAAAQDSGTPPPPPPAPAPAPTVTTTTTSETLAEPTANGKGASVVRTRDTTTTTTTNSDGTSSSTVDQVVNVQTVTTPSGNVTRVIKTTDANGET
ncbi:MAG: hypothetical protein GXC70_03135, partial [Sphingomonadaceae bacterium]|nr:hypothetical protein [Sphingomonadaceae bacterium]